MTSVAVAVAFLRQASLQAPAIPALVLATTASGADRAVRGEVLDRLADKYSPGKSETGAISARCS